MSLEELTDTFNQRKILFEGYQTELLRKLYSRMKRGVEIRTDDMLRMSEGTDQDLSKLFVKIPQVEDVKIEVQNALEELDYADDFTVKAIFGDYGHGKSQCAHLTMLEVLRFNDHKQDYTTN